MLAAGWVQLSDYVWEFILPQKESGYSERGRLGGPRSRPQSFGESVLSLPDTEHRTLHPVA